MPDINQLYAFIERADTIQKARIAERYFKEHKNELSHSTFDELMQALEYRRKIIFRENWKKINAYEARMLIIAENTGEVVSEF